MIGLNPWPLSRDKFCFIWLESGNCRCGDVIKGGASVKGSTIDSIFIIKVFANRDEGVKIVGQWFGKLNWNDGCISGLLEFIRDGYLVSLYGEKYVFRVVDECLGRNKLPLLDRDYVMDIGEVFGWVEDEEWVKERMKGVEEIYWREGDGKDKLLDIIGWFGENMLPLLRNGFR